jgi:FkbM family methyltransferase
MTNIFSTFCGLLANKIVNDSYKGKPPRLKQKIYNFILRFIDPAVNVYVGSNKLKMLFSQKTPYYYATFSTYDRALPRICEMVQKIDIKLIIIDLGANIGDTASLISEKVDGASILCIEGDKKFLPFLYENSLSIKNNTVFIEPKYCVDTLDNNKFNVENENGTAHLFISENNTIENINTLDNIVNENLIFKNTNILKIDTDGFEITVLNGAKGLLKQKHPIIFFEFTPEAYISNNQNPMDLIKLLNSFGYEKALFYDNFGIAEGIYNLSDNNMIERKIDKIDKKNIHYYDILCVHKTDEERYMNILRCEAEKRK